MGLLKIFFVISLFTLMFGQLARIDFRNGIAFTATDISVGVCFFYWVATTLVKKNINAYKKDSIFRATGFFIIVCIASLLANAQRFSAIELSISSLYLLRWIAYASIYMVVKSFDDAFKKKIPFLLLAIGVITAFSGYIQYIYFNSLKSLFYLGWDDHMYRVFSVFLDPNFVGAFFVLLMIMIVTHIKRFASIVLFVVTTTAIFLTHSRSTLIMFLVSGITFFIIIQKKRFIFLLIILIVGVTLLFYSQFYIENINLFRIVSTKARIETTSNALIAIKENPILGVGFNTFRYYQIQKGLRVGEGAIYSHSDAGTDSSLLFVLATTGLIGFLAYVLILKKIIEKALFQIKIGNSTERKIGILVITSIIGLLSHSFFVNSLFYPFIMLWIWVICGLLSNKNAKENR